ncbi:MAG: TlyA family RNA methyltransferase [Chloroflexota bacterium]
MEKERLDVLLVEKGLIDSRSLAQRLIMAGEINVNGQIILKPATKITIDSEITIIKGPRFVSRGGEKLEAALLAFNNDVLNKICADVGASTGGFTDCLIQNGAVRVYAIDVGEGILEWKLRNDRRIVVMEGTNARYIEKLPETVDLITVDASFISLKTLLPKFRGWLNPSGNIIALIKPQFEAGRKEVARGKGVIRDPQIHLTVLVDILTFAQSQNMSINGIIRSPIQGPKGNIEFLAWLQLNDNTSNNNVTIENIYEISKSVINNNQ